MGGGHYGIDTYCMGPDHLSGHSAGMLVWLSIAKRM